VSVQAETGAGRVESLRELGLSVYAPTLLFAIGQGAVIPVIAIAAREVGASITLAGFIVALRGIGVLAFDIPAGWLVARFGERLAMAAGTALVIVSLVAAALAPNPWIFAVASFVMGCGWSVWLLARLTYVSEAVPLSLRGRALSTLGGINRVGNFIGPFLGAGVATFAGVMGAYGIHIVTAAIASVLLLFLIEDGEGKETGGHEHVNLPAVVREHANVFLTAGVGTTAIQVLRATRQSVLPLWASHIGLDAGAVSLVFGISMAMEMTMFYPAGAAMDNLGRKWVAVPCLAIMSIGMILLPATHHFWPLTIVGILIGFGNGLGSGIVMTLGADLAPTVGRAQFLGAWRLCGDIGTAGGPLLAAAIAGAVSLAGASLAMGAVGLAGASLIYFRMPETLQRKPRVQAAAESGGAAGQ